MGLFLLIYKMNNLSKIKNYIYGKGILSRFTSDSIIGMHKSKQFKIFYSTKVYSKGKAQLIIEIDKKRINIKDSKEIVRLLEA